MALADSADPAVPFNGIKLPGLTPVDKANDLTFTRIEAALHNGGERTQICTVYRSRHQGRNPLILAHH